MYSYHIMKKGAEIYMKRVRRTASAAAMLCCVLLLALLTKNTNIAADGIKKGLSLVENVLLPTLFPLLVASELFVASDILAKAPLLVRPCRKLLGVSREGSVALTLGWLFGAPVGALAAIAELEAGRIEKKEFLRLTCLTATPSMGFLVGVVGGGIFSSPLTGLLLYGATVFSAVLLSICWRLLDKSTPIIEKTHPNVMKKAGFADVFTASVKNSIWTFLQITAFVLVFSALGAYLSALATFCHLPDTAAAVLGGLLELTAGVAQASKLSSPVHSLLLIAFFAGFAGLSILLQVLSVTGRHAPPLRLLLAIKLLQGVLTVLTVKIILMLGFPVSCVGEGALQTLAGPLQMPFPIGKWLLLLLLLYLFFHRVLTKPLVYFKK